MKVQFYFTVRSDVQEWELGWGEEGDVQGWTILENNLIAIFLSQYCYFDNNRKA